MKCTATNTEYRINHQQIQPILNEDMIVGDIISFEMRSLVGIINADNPINEIDKASLIQGGSGSNLSTLSLLNDVNLSAAKSLFQNTLTVDLVFKDGTEHQFVISYPEFKILQNRVKAYRDNGEHTEAKITRPMSKIEAYSIVEAKIDRYTGQIFKIILIAGLALQAAGLYFDLITFISIPSLIVGSAYFIYILTSGRSKLMSKPASLLQPNEYQYLLSMKI